MRLPSSLLSSVRKLYLAAAVCLLSYPAGLAAQVLLTGSGPDNRVRPQTTDLAIFVAGRQREDLPCVVSPNKPVLGFDLRLHTSYEIAVPLEALAGHGNTLGILFRVIPQNEQAKPVYFSQRIRVPSIEEDAGGTAYLEGGFDVGEGRYRVEWLMRDQGGRVCSSFWKVNAHLSRRDSQIHLNIAPWEVQQIQLEQFADEPPVVRTDGPDSLRVKILVNFAPQNPRSATLQPTDTSALVAILRTLSRESRISKFSVVAFNLHERRVLYRADSVDRIDFPALGSSLETLDLGTIDLQRLKDKNGETSFLANLIQREIASADHPDALIIAGPKVMLDRKIPERTLAALGQLSYPVFYMNYNLDPYENPWRDTVGEAVKFLNGQEYTITAPRDLWIAVRRMVTEIERIKQTRREKAARSEERRVGKECRSRWAPDH